MTTLCLSTAKKRLGFHNSCSRKEFEKYSKLTPVSFFKEGNSERPLYDEDAVNIAAPFTKRHVGRPSKSGAPEFALVADLLAEIQKNVTAIHLRLDRIEANQVKDQP